MSLVVYFISFFLFWHQTGQYIVRITERTGLMLSTNILTCIFYVIFQSQCEHKIVLEPEFIEKRLLRAGKIIRTQFLAKRYLKLTRRLFSSCNQAYHYVCLEVFVLKLLNIFCIPMLLHVQLVTGLLSVRVLKEENCLVCYVFITKARLIRF